ncbi:MAG: hypothetical protein ACLP29_11215 [Dissulfurispiraceae bacterium]
MLSLLIAAEPHICSAELIDRVVAYVDDHAITYSEFRQKLEKMKEAAPNITEEEAINSMINNVLLLDQAHKLKLEAPSDDDLIKEYLDIRIKLRVFIKEDKLMAYYTEHKKELGGREYLSVRDEIEKYLSELEINKQLKELLQDLRKQSNIVIQLKDEL